MKQNFQGTHTIAGELCTLNLIPGTRVYGEHIIKKHGKEYRGWDLYRSKLATALKQGLRNFPFAQNSKILYLGAGNGTTASHLADICTKGLIYCVEFSPRAMTDLFQVCEQRKNLSPILADANKPDEYLQRISGKMDIIYQDIAQKFQVDILNKNVDTFLNKNGWVFLMVKARSIDVTLEPKKVFNLVGNQLMSKYKIFERIQLDPYEKDHMCIVAKLK